jgi:hypothetical protein
MCNNDLTHSSFIGFLISALCDEENSAIHLAMGSFFPDLVLSGITWPVEGMPIFLRKIAQCMPHTVAIGIKRI